MLLGPLLLDPKGQFRPKNHLTLLSLSGLSHTQSEELTRGPPELVQPFVYRGSVVHIGARGLAKSLALVAYPSGEDGGNFLVQMISTCLCYT
jgi:hypothetical protein